MLSQSRVAYDQDFNLWLAQTVTALKEGRFEQLDCENLIDELESMSKRDKREILNRLDGLLMHLLKWLYQPSHRSTSWESSIRNHRKEIGRILEDSPSLQSYPHTILSKAYSAARLDAARETQLPLSIFPVDCPFSVEAALDPDFWPESPCPSADP